MAVPGRGADLDQPQDGRQRVTFCGAERRTRRARTGGRRTLEETSAASAVIIGAGYVGLEMADAPISRGLIVTQIGSCPKFWQPSTPSSASWLTPS